MLNPHQKITNRVIEFSVLLPLCLYALLLTSCTLPSIVWRATDPGEIAMEFVDAYVVADVERAKAVTLPEKWEDVEQWLNGRQAFGCVDGGWDTGTSANGIYDSEKNEWKYSLTYQCASEQTPYCVSVDDVQIMETDDGWKVYDWRTTYDASNYGYACQ